VTHFSEPSAEERLAGQQVGQSSDEPVNDRGEPQAAAEEGSQDATPPGGTGETPEQMAARLQELTADLQRLQAEYVNYKRRVDRDRELVLQNAKFSILSALLPVLDDVDRARERAGRFHQGE
jgi:molecular chaperone GrpE